MKDRNRTKRTMKASMNFITRTPRNKHLVLWGKPRWTKVHQCDFNCWSVQKNQNVNGAKTNTRDKPTKWSKQAAWNTRKRESFIVGFVSNWLEDRVEIFPDKIRPSAVRQWILDYFEHSIENFSLVLTCAFKRYTLILRVSPTSLIYEWLPQY